MNFKKITPSDLEQFKKLISPDRILTDEANLRRCASDATEDYVFFPEVVVQPEDALEVSRLIAYCNDQNIPVTPRGAGTGLSGGALPAYGGLCLDMRRMNRILKIDTANFQVITEPGVITEVLQDKVKEKNLFYPVDPASKGSCFIGGNVAENSGGPRAVKYGTVKDYVLNLEAVLPDGRVIWTGADTLKNATGYNLTQLITGSEGTLAVITKIVLKLLPCPVTDVLMLVPFHSAEDACHAVNDILLAGFTPSALEFMERDALLCAMEYSGDKSIEIHDAIGAHLLIEMDGKDKEMLFQEMESVSRLLEAYPTGEILFAEDHAQKQKLWKLRRIVGEAAKKGSIYKEEDTVVPRACLPELLKTVKRIGNKFGFASVCYGHAGDGNLHVNILKGNLSEEAWKHTIPKAVRELFEYVHSLRGTISGEHGIGYVQKPYTDIVFNTTQLSLMKGIKKLFDPKGILNPGKLFEF